MVTEQNPLIWGFGATTTAKAVLAGLDLSGKIAVVTGGYSGIALETTRAPPRELGVPIAPQSSLHRTRAIAALCAELNRKKTLFPGSSLRLHYAFQGPSGKSERFQKPYVTSSGF